MCNNIKNFMAQIVIQVTVCTVFSSYYIHYDKIELTSHIYCLEFYEYYNDFISKMGTINSMDV